jgi:hypothetical protein
LKRSAGRPKNRGKRSILICVLSQPATRRKSSYPP